jgi:membrane protease subunit HflK
VLQYSVNEDELAKYVVQQDRVDDLVARAAETVLTEWAAGRSVDDILLNGKAELPEVLVKETQQQLDDYELGIRIRDASVTLLLPPAEVKDAFDAVNQAQTAIRTRRYQEEQNATEERGRAEAEVDRLLQEAEAEAQEQRQRARTDAANFLKRLRKLQRFLAKNPGEFADYLHDLWLNGMKKVRDRMRARGGRIEPLDKFLGLDRIDVFQGARPDRK